MTSEPLLPLLGQLQGAHDLSFWNSKKETQTYIEDFQEENSCYQNNVLKKQYILMLYSVFYKLAV